MSTPPSNYLATLWLKWKSLKLPWRRRWLAGQDLAGNTYWYFKPTLSAPNTRRILQNNPKIPYSDLDISPSWHQWLRHTRPTPPSLQEQRADVQRQVELKRRAQLADERWKAQGSFIEKPRRGNLEVGIGDGEKEGTVGRRGEMGKVRGAGEEGEGEKREREREEWRKERVKGAPGQGWQPEAWTPGRVRR
ncbi:hypothetical protein ACLMJK_000603 [Lecanora helva]